jgi:sec-independent protein translocase protein TatC
MASILNRVPFSNRRKQGPTAEPLQPPVPTEEEFVEMSLQEHLEELRSRILKAAVAVLLSLIVGLILAPKVLSAIYASSNVTDDRAVVISPTEPFIVYMRVSLYIAVAIAMPVLVYQLMSFIAPGLTSRERKYIFRAVPFVVLSFAAGVAFAFFLLAPRALEFLSTFGMSYFRWDPRASEIVSFYLTLMLGVGLIFELPVLMYALTFVGVMNAKRYGKFRKFAFVLAMIVAAIVTPTPDPFNMMLVAIPTYLLYEIGILLSRTIRREAREA